MDDHSGGADKLTPMMEADADASTVGADARGHLPTEKERAYQLILARITDGSYPQGSRLVLRDLASSFRMSTIPVREAIAQLEAAGWVRSERHRGAVVAALSPEDWADALRHLAVIEGYATALAAPHLDGAALEELRGLDAEMQAAVDANDFQLLQRSSEAFHRRIIERCPSRSVREATIRLHDRIGVVDQRAMSLLMTPHAVADHERLLDLIESGASSDRIEQAARSHRMAAERPRVA